MSLGGEQMCESNVFIISQGDEKELMKDVLGLEVHGDYLLLTSLLGDEKKVHARIKNIDFGNHKVILEEM
jgi:predicted RNA-binding protein